MILSKLNEIILLRKKRTIFFFFMKPTEKIGSLLGIFFFHFLIRALAIRKIQTTH